MAGKSRKHIFLWVYFIGTIILVAADQITKVIAENMLYKKEPFVIIDGVFEFFYLRNEGAAWGMLSGKRIFFLIITLTVVALITFVVFKMPAVKKYVLAQICCTLITAGALGNFIDRLQFGYVRDFVYFKLIDFPVFNVADSYVSIAVVLMIICIFFVYKEEDLDFIKISRKKNDNIAGE